MEILGNTFHNVFHDYNTPAKNSTTVNTRAWIVATGFYLLFPIGMAYIEKYRIAQSTLLNIDAVPSFEIAPIDNVGSRF